MCTPFRLILFQHSRIPSNALYERHYFGLAVSKHSELYTTWNLESTGWNPESKTVLDSLQREIWTTLCCAGHERSVHGLVSALKAFDCASLAFNLVKFNL